MIDLSYLKALKFFMDRLESSNITWAVTGSLGMALQGVPVVPNDIDIQTDEKGAYEIQEHFSECVLKPVTFSSDKTIKSHFGSIKVFDILIEIMGGVQKLLPNGSWEPPVDIKPYYQFVKLEGLNIPVLSLEYEEQAYRKFGRIKRADLLKKYLEKKTSVFRSSDKNIF